MKNSNLAELFSNILSKKLELDYMIGKDHIHTDSNNWCEFVPKKLLLPNHPLIMRHYRGPIFVVIPFTDSKTLIDEETITNYINKATWSMGYYWGGGSIFNSVYWQPIGSLDNCIFDKETIKEYLEILGCRTCNRSSGFVPYEEYCNKCYLEKCWYSDFKESSIPLPEKDLRLSLYLSIKDHLFIKYGFYASHLYLHSFEDNVAIISPSYIENDVFISISAKVLIDLLYHPDQDHFEIFKKLEYFVQEPSSYSDNNEFIPGDLTRITKDYTHDSIVDFWKKTNENFEWFKRF